MKYRVWCHKDQKWEKDIVVLQNGDLVTPVPVYSRPTNAYSYRVCSMKTDHPVQYCTGLLDINGREIYEGDIVKYKISGGHIDEIVERIGCVEITPEGVNPRPIDERMDQWNAYPMHSFDFQVIGNILENPELLK